MPSSAGHCSAVVHVSLLCSSRMRNKRRLPPATGRVYGLFDWSEGAVEGVPFNGFGSALSAVMEGRWE